MLSPTLARWARLLSTLAILTTAACSAPTATDDPANWDLEDDTNPCASGTLVSTGLPDIDAFKQPVCLVDHPAEEVTKTNEVSNPSQRPECHLDITHYPKEFGYYGDVQFDMQIHDNCAEGIVNCANYNVFMRFPRLSSVWHRFQVRPPNSSCSYNKSYWYWKFSDDKYIWFVYFRADDGHLVSPIYDYRIEVFDHQCRVVSGNDRKLAATSFSLLNFVVELLPSGEIINFSSLKSGDSNHILPITYSIPLNSACVIDSVGDWIKEEK